MCGIAGIISGSKIDIKKNILKITQSLKHRGPDSNDTWIDNDNGVAFGHTRLSIIDLSFHGNQPMHSHNNRYVIVYNGEIYNFKSLKKYIEESGHLKTNWNSSTDTEIILEYINIFGIKKALNDFNGMFAFAIWDKKEKILILARDKFGEKPLYYGWIDNDFYFSSELSAINQLHKNKLKICHKALSLYTQLGYVPSPLSIYQKISKLQAGQYICLQIENIQKIDSYFYFSPEIQYCHSNLNLKKKIVDDEKNIETFLRKSISEKLVADVPVGVFLSGGIDSSLIAAIAQDEYFKSEGKSIKTFTIGFKDKKYDESVYARKISIHLNTDHHEEILDKNKIINIIPKIPIIYGEPFADYSSIPTYLVSELAKSKVKVALSGDGGDELFGGYSRYIYADYFKSILNKLPLKILLLLKKVLLSISINNYDRIYNFFYAILFKKKISFFGEKIHKFANILDQKSEKEIYKKIITLWDDCLKIKINDNGKYYESDVWTSDLNFKKKMMLVDMANYLVDDILVKVDRASMFHSLECRAPFLDANLYEYVSKLSINKLFNQKKQGKLVLKKILSKYIPNKLIDRPKMGFGFNIGEVLTSDLIDWSENLLDSKNFLHEYFDRDIIINSWNDLKKNKLNNSHKIWTILTFHNWYNEFYKK